MYRVFQYLQITIHAFLLIYFVPNAASAETRQEKIQQIRNLIKDTCLSGDQFDIQADINGNISIRGLLPGADGRITANVRNGQGAVNYLNEQIRKSAETETRSCLERYMPRLIDILLEDLKSGNKDNNHDAPSNNANNLSSMSYSDGWLIRVYQNNRSGSGKNLIGRFVSLDPGSIRITDHLPDVPLAFNNFVTIRYEGDGFLDISKEGTYSIVASINFKGNFRCGANMDFNGHTLMKITRKNQPVSGDIGHADQGMYPLGFVFQCEHRMGINPTTPTLNLYLLGEEDLMPQILDAGEIVHQKGDSDYAIKN